MKNLLIFLAPLLCWIHSDAQAPSTTLFQKTWPAFNSFSLNQPVALSRDALTWQSALDNDRFMSDPNGRKGFLLLQFSAAPNADTTRTPLNVCMVIDRSGSMQGVKLGYAKKAAKAMVDLLRPTDFLSIVIYDNTVDSLLSPVHVTDAAAIKRLIDRITPRGSTNLWGGAEMGYGFVVRNQSTNFMNRVLLLSDGMANVGLTDSLIIHQNVLKFRKEGITLSTFGMGLDYNERLMTDMAETGQGNFYNIDSPDRLTALFRKEILSLSRPSVAGLTVNIPMPAGIHIRQIYPAVDHTRSVGLLQCRLPDLAAGASRPLLIGYEIEEGWKKEIVWKMEANWNRSAESFSLTTTLHLLPAKNAKEYLSRYQGGVVKESLRFAANETMEKAMDQTDKLDYAAAKQEIVHLTAFFDSNRTYVDGYPKLVQADSLGKSYASFLMRIGALPVDSVRAYQKWARERNYQLRN